MRGSLWEVSPGLQKQASPCLRLGPWIQMGPLGVCEVNPGMGGSPCGWTCGQRRTGRRRVTGAPWAAWQGGWVPAPCGQVLPKSGGWRSVLRCSWVWMLPARTTGRGGRVQSVPAKPEPAPWKTLVSPEGPFWWGALIPPRKQAPTSSSGNSGP